MLELQDITSVLNIGSGVSFEPHNDFWKEIFKAKNKIAFDLNRGKLKSWIDTEWIPIQGDASKLLDIFVDRSFDLVIATDLIEHLNKEEGLKFIENLEIITKSAIVIFTPNGFLDTEKYQSADVHSDLDVHKSGWTEEDFKKLGFQTELVKDLHNFGDVKFDGLWAWKICE